MNSLTKRHYRAGIIASLFYFAMVWLQNILISQGIFFILPLLGLQFSVAAIFFPLWEFFYFIPGLKKRISRWLCSPALFFIFMGLLDYRFWKFFVTLFMMMLIFEYPGMRRIKLFFIFLAFILGLVS
jgi:hypothetical protein